ncbi:hypothetical protein CYJ73_15465 [Gordonia terrae]|uniref:Uncharacterized protein n=1 Tax=Gordonia terrae TaxID=2055 RepID=A0A2I1R5Y8_9ACTN|nr:hypothetical protein CYJ73_15465 [Gordonia terrae]
MSGTRSGATRLGADDRREEMIAAAQVIFAERPYDSVSTAELARAAGTAMRMESSRVSRARIRAFLGMVSAATTEWLERETLSKEEVLALLVRTAVALGD